VRVADQVPAGARPRGGAAGLADVARRAGAEGPGDQALRADHWVEAPLGSERTYDGTVDCWFDSREAFEAAWTSPEWAALLEDDVRLFDRDRTPAFEGAGVDEYVMRWDAAPDARPYHAAGPGAG